MAHRTRALLLLMATFATQLRAQAAPKSSGWIALFDGHSTAAWRGYNKPALPAGWQVVAGALTRVAEAGDIVSKDNFDNFELELEWKIAKGSNSGIFFHVQEDSALAMYMSGPEMQVLDNKVHQDGLEPRTSAGSNYALHAPVRDVTKPVGEWNKVRIIVNGPHVEHWLNGVKIVEYELWSDDWKQRVAESKFKAWPAYGIARTGHIGLQDHGDWVAYRNIRIRPIN
ncbi:MAG TPA: DUF1080 domain-containing protein [Longimicrobiales bacterium]